MPSTKHLHRRLTGVMSIDVVGYSRLVSANEESAYRHVRELLVGFVAPLIRRCDGRIFKKTGDGFLVEFSSIVQATLCAVLVQQGMRMRQGENVHLRIGIHLGEVIVEPDDLYGDDVNIAVRLESIAEAGGICVSQIVAQQVEGKLPITLVDQGMQNLRNIVHPIRVFSVTVPEADLRLGRRPATLAAGKPKLQPNSAHLRPAVAVLPFVNLSEEADQEYFADGLTEDLIAALAGWQGLPIISRGSTFAFKKRPHNIRAIGARLGAIYVLEGSVRRAGARARISVQLIEAQTEENIFASHYDCTLSDIFALQDDISRSIVGAISPELLRRERERVAHSTHRNLDAYELYQRGLWYHYHYSRDHVEQAEVCFRRALDLDKDYGPAASALALCIGYLIMNGWAGSDRYADAISLAGRAVALNPRDPQAHFALGTIYYHAGQVDIALRELEDAIRLNPSHAAAFANLGFLYNYKDLPSKALQSASEAFRLSPADVRQFMWYTALSGSHYLLGQYHDAVEAGQRGLTIKPDYRHNVRYVVAGLGQLGHRAEAHPYLAMLKEVDGGLAGTERILKRVFNESALVRILNGLSKAGFE